MATAGGILIMKTDKNGDTIWTKNIPGALGYGGEDICQTFDGGFVVGADFTFLKTDSFGNVQWDVNMFGCYAVKQCKNGDIIATGIATGGPDYYGATLVDSAGNIIWERSYGNINDPWNYYAASDVVELPDSNFMVVCDDHIPGGWYLMKLNRINGDTMFTKNYSNVNGLNSLCPMVYTSDSNLAIAYGYYLKKIDLSGNEIWNQPLTINSYEIVGCSDGGIAGAGEIYPSPPNSKVAYYKTDSLVNIYNFQGINNLYGHSEVWVYPNPVTTTATMHFKNPQQQHVTLTVYDVLGNAVIQKQTVGNSFTINAASLKSGMYFYTLNAGSGLCKGKLVVE